MNNEPQLIKHNQTIYEYMDGGIIDGYVKSRAADPPAGQPWIRWKGSKIPHALWQQMLAFFIWTYDKTKPSADESMVQLYYNEETRDWLAWAPPQRGWGMSVKTLDDHPNWKQSEAFVGYQLLGTGHHHCSASAFQSGTDHADEKQANGLHFTVGHLDKQYLNLHARVVFNGNMQEVKLEDWVELADRYRSTAEQLPELIPLMAGYSYESRPPESVEVPQQWKDNFLKVAPAVTSYGPYGSSYNSHHSSGTGNSNNGVGTWTPKSDAVAIRNVTTKTPAELGEEALDALEKTGVTFFEIAAACGVLNKYRREEWNMKHDVVRALADIIHKYGLNPRWLEKWVESESTVRTEQAYGFQE